MYVQSISTHAHKHAYTNTQQHLHYCSIEGLYVLFQQVRCFHLNWLKIVSLKMEILGCSNHVYVISLAEKKIWRRIV